MIEEKRKEVEGGIMRFYLSERVLLYEESKGHDIRIQKDLKTFREGHNLVLCGEFGVRRKHTGAGQ